MYPDSSALQEALLKVIHGFHQKGWAPATSANYSFRNPDHSGFTISRSGVDKGEFRLEDFMQVDAKGRPLAGFEHLKPSAETLLHALLYERAEVQAVLHTHSVANTVFSYKHRGRKSVEINGFELLKGIAGIHTHEATLHLPVFENTQDMVALSAALQAELPNFRETPGFLLAGHGLYAWGSSIAEAKRHVETLEFLMEVMLQLPE